MTSRTVVVVVLSSLLGCHTISSPLELVGQPDGDRDSAPIVLASAQLKKSAAVLSVDRKQSTLTSAVALVRAGRDQDALSVLTVALREDPDNVAAIRLVAQISRRVGDWTLQNAALQQLIQLEPDSASVQHQSGKALLQGISSTPADQKRVETSLSALRRAVELEPDNPRYAQDLFVALTGQHRDVEAESVLIAAIVRCPRDSQLPMAAARYFEARGRWQEAVQQYNAALQISPRNRLWRRQRGICHARLELWDEACDDLQPALLRTPVRSQITEFLVWANAAHRAGRLEKTLEILDQLAAQANYRNSETEVLRVRCLMQLKQFDAAKDSLLQAVVDWPSDMSLRRFVSEFEQAGRRSATAGDLAVPETEQAADAEIASGSLPEIIRASAARGTVLDQ